MTINQLSYLNTAYRYLNINKTSATKSLRNLSSGYRINSAADDAAGLAVSEKMRAQIGGLSKAYENAQQGISMIQTADGYLGSTTSALQEMRQLAVQAGNGTYSDADRALLDQRFQELKEAVTGYANSAQYNKINLLDGSLGGTVGVSGVSNLGIDSIAVGGTGDLSGTGKFTISQENGTYSITAQIGGETITNTIAAGDTDTTFTLADGNTVTLDFGSVGNLAEGVITNVDFNAGSVDLSGAVSAGAGSQLYLQIGANGGADQRMGISMGDMTALGLGIDDLSIDSLSNANSAIVAIDKALDQVNSQRSSLGASQNRLEHTMSNLAVSKENMVASESRIRDADMALEIMNFTQRTIQMQATQAMLAQGMNLSRMNMLSLLLR